MKLLAGFLVLLGLTAAGMPLLVAAVVATHPWLAVGALNGSLVVHDNRPAPVRGGVPDNQWRLMLSAATDSTCNVRPEDLAAIASVESNFGRNLFNPQSGTFGYGQFDSATWATFGGGDPNAPADALPAIARTLCARGYGVDRLRALNSYGGCQTALCLGETDYATAINRLATGFAGLAAAASAGAMGGTLVQIAQQWLGVPYVFGGCSPSGVDCSCLVQRVYQTAGVTLPRTAADQYNATARVVTADLQPGDLVFFANTYMPGISHVGIYIGGGQQINAPTEGQRVSVQPVFDGYWGAHFVGGGRARS